MNILLVEDNEIITEALKYSLEKNNYHLIAKNNIKDTLDYLKNNNPNLIILDITLPDGSGLGLFKQYIVIQNIPTIFLTANDSEEVIVESLEIGAEDYLTKPFSTKELIARINKILRKLENLNIIKIKDITFDTNKMELKRDNQVIELTPLELKIINLLFLNINKVVSRNVILDKVFE